MRTALLSVGHSNHSAEAFVALLRRAGVTAIADVRSSPYSRRLPQFNREDLQTTLRTNDIAYVFLGDLLGGRPASPALYDPDGLVNYERVRQTDAFRQGLARLLGGAERYVIAMMCGEADPLDCHRGLMIAPALVEMGVPPGHLRKDGTCETTAEFEERLLRETKLTDRLEGTLFEPAPPRGAVLAEAYRAMARKKAFRLEFEGGAEPV
jgi:uncharacterized protein (DUF488 family)